MLSRLSNIVKIELSDRLEQIDAVVRVVVRLQCETGQIQKRIPTLQSSPLQRVFQTNSPQNIPKNTRLTPRHHHSVDPSQPPPPPIVTPPQTKVPSRTEQTKTEEIKINRSLRSGLK